MTLHTFPVSGTLALPPRGIGLLADGTGVTCHVEDGTLWLVEWKATGPVATSLADRVSAAALGVDAAGERVAVAYVSGGRVIVIDDPLDGGVEYDVGATGAAAATPSVAVGPDGPVVTWTVATTRDAPGDGMISIGGAPGVVAIAGTCVNMVPAIDMRGVPLFAWRDSTGKGDNRVCLRSYAEGAATYTLGTGSDPDVAIGPTRTTITGHAGGRVRVWTMPDDLVGVVPYSLGSAFGHVTERDGTRAAVISTYPSTALAQDKHSTEAAAGRGLVVAVDRGNGWALTYPFGEAAAGFLSAWGVALRDGTAFCVVAAAGEIRAAFWSL